MVITGNKGFIGSALEARAMRDGKTAIGIPERIRHGGTITLDNPDGVFVHLGAEPGVVDSIKDPIGCFEANTSATVEYLAIALDHGTERFLFASSAAATMPPAHPYGASKVASEAWCLAFTNAYSMPTLVMRLSNVYGPGSRDKSSVIATMCKDALDGLIFVHGNGKQTRNFIYIDDVVDAFMDAAYGDLMVGVRNVCAAEQHSISTVAEIIQSLTGAEIRYSERRIGDVDSSTLTTAKPGMISLEEGIATTLEYFKRLKHEN